MLTEQQGKVLVRLARQTLEKELGRPLSSPVAEQDLDDSELRQHRGVFVTLKLHGMLRGCIGSLLGVEPIIDGVRRHAVNAALHDRRFPVLTADELPQVRIEVSVLTPPQNVEYIDSADLIRQLRPGVDGVILKIPGGPGATFLPQVWEELPEPEAFLEQLCRKAGLPGNSWQSGGLTVQTYQVCHFDEQELQKQA
jgi:AmmeMemoRadiSam system protein A